MSTRTNAALDACVANAAKELGIPERDAKEIAERIEAFRRRKTAEGRLDRLDRDVRSFAKGEAERARIAAALKRKQAALNVVLRDEWEQDLARLKGAGLDAREAIMAKLVGSYASVAGARKSASARRIALEADWLRGVAREVEAEAPGVLELLRRPKSAKPLLDAVVREVAELKDGGNPGRTGSPTARKVAEVLARYAEASRLEANRAGADIGRLDGWAGPQRHDAAKLLKTGRDAWVRAILPGLDVERSFGPGAEPEAILSDTWDNIVTGRGQGTGIFEGQAKALAALFSGRPKKDGQDLAALLGVGFDAGLGDIAARFAAEDSFPGRMTDAQNGSSPRARGTRVPPVVSPHPTAVHPRVRGERVGRVEQLDRVVGFIPACAGNATPV